MEQREIKFKYLSDKRNGYFAIAEFTLQQIENGEASVWMERNFINPDYLHRLQSTGLKDKNGKEIYEGDVIDGRRYYRPALYGRRAVPEMTPGNAYALGELNRWHDVVEVIGNIYQNSDLLV